MATITTNTFLDGGTARTAGETWSLNGAVLTIRTDTRWHANAPASMTGSIGSVSVSAGLGGSLKVDGTKVRWMSYNSGTGNVPAIGTTVTQGGVSGYLLGVYADYTSAPTAVAAAMPASGFIKFREVTGGTYSAGTLTGIGASAASPDVTGWIEICADQSAQLASYDLGDGTIFSGSWFYLDNTTGTRGQQISTPTNGGGTGTHVFAVQIETAPGSNVYEWFPTQSATLGSATWTTANFTTDARVKFVETMGNGVIRIGSDGTNNIGYLPPSGCKVRMPNIFGRTVATASRSANAVPASVPRAALTGGKLLIEGAHLDFTQSAPQLVSFITRNSAWEVPALLLAKNRDPIIFENVNVGSFMALAGAGISFDSINGGTFTDVKVSSQPFVIGLLYMSGPVANLTFTNTEIIATKVRTGGSVSIYSAAACSNVTFTNVKMKACGVSVTNSSNLKFVNVDYIDRLEGATTAANGLLVFNMSGCANTKVDGLTFGEGGTIANTQPYTGLWQSGSTPCYGTKLRNWGTRAAPLSAGSSATFYPGFLFAMSGADYNTSLQRLYITATRSGPFGNGVNYASSGILFEDVYILNYPAGQPERSTNGIFRKIGTAVPTTVPQQNQGTHWADYFTADTTGTLRWNGSAPSSATSDRNYLVVTPAQGTGYIGSTAQISLDTLNDALYSEMAWNVLGHTGFQNAAPVVTGVSTGIVISYQLDTGSGFSGTWKTANAANLSAETVSAAGFKMKIRLQQTGSANTTTSISAINFLTTSTASAQATNLYPLDTVLMGFSGLIPGTEVRAYVGTDPATAIEIGGTESTGGSTFSFTHSSAGQVGFIHIFAMGYQPIYLPYTYPAADTSLLIQQVIDRNYYNPA